MAPKRKASELEASPDLNGHQTSRTGKRKTKKENIGNTAQAPDHGYTVEVDPQSDDEERGPIKLWNETKWSIDFTITPSSWYDFKSYKNFILPSSKQDPFRLGEIVYIAKNQSTPAAPVAPATPDDATELSREHEEEVAAYSRALLKYNKEHFWLGKILQIRASAPEKVLLLVVWLYWPSELPRGYRQPWFSESEVLASNYMDVVDATTVSDRANVVYLDETIDSNLYESFEQIFQKQLAAAREEQAQSGRKVQAEDAPPILFWRQTFDSQAHKRNPKLKYADATSGLREFCICHQPSNPDKKMFQCPKCQQWNHDDCLVDDIGARASKELAAGNIEEWVRDNAMKENATTFTERVSKGLQAVGGFLASEVEQIAESGIQAIKQETTTELHAVTTTNSNGNGHGEAAGAAPSPPESVTRQRGRPRKVSKAASSTWKAKLSVSIISKGDRSQDSPPTARITEKRGQKRTWDVKIDCLDCGATLD